MEFDGGDLVGADFSGATLRDVTFSSVNLRSAVFSGAELTDVTWEQVTCPSGRSSEDLGGTCEPDL